MLTAFSRRVACGVTLMAQFITKFYELADIVDYRHADMIARPHAFWAPAAGLTAD